MKNLKYFAYSAAFAFILLAAACGSATEGPELSNSPNSAGNDTAAVSEETGPAAGSSGAVETASPDAIVAELYKTHDAKKSPFFQTKDRALVDKYFVKETADLIWRDAKESAENNTVGLGFDPLYDGQDFEIKNFKITPGTTKDAISSATTEFTNFGEKQTVTFLLREDSGIWKIENIRYKHGTLLAILREQFKAPKEEVISEPASFAGKYRVGTTTCTVLPIRMAFEITWAKGSGSEIFHFKEGTTFEASTDDGVNQFVFDDDRYDTGTFRRADGKTFPIRRAK